MGSNTEQNPNHYKSDENYIARVGYQMVDT